MPPRVIGRHFPSRRTLSGSFLLHLFLRNSLKSEPDGGRFAAERRCMRRNEAACTDRPSTVTVPSGRIQSGAFDDDGGHARLRSRFVSFAGLPKNRLTRADRNPVGCFAAHPTASRHHQKQLIHPCRMKTDDTAGSKCMHPSWKSPSERTIREPPTFRLPNRLIMCRTSASKRKNRMDSLPKFFTPRRVPPFVKRFRSRGSLMKRLAKIRFFPAFKRIHLTGLRNSAQYEKIAERPGSKIFVADGVGGEAFRPQKKPAENPGGGHRPCLLRLKGRRENRGGRAAELRGNSTAGPVHGVSGAGHSHRTPAI